MHKLKFNSKISKRKYNKNIGMHLFMNRNKKKTLTIVSNRRVSEQENGNQKKKNWIC